MPKRFFWLKLKEDFFEEKYLKALRRLPQGDSLAIIYLKMQLKSLKTEGIIKYEGILPDSISELALALDEDEQVVRLAVEALIRFGVVERWDDETLYMSAMQQLIGSESDSAERVRKHRALKNERKALPCNGDVTPSNTEKEIELEEDKEEDKEEKKEEKKKGGTRESAADIEEEFNSLWSLYPRKEGKANALKAYVKARKGHPEVFGSVKSGIEAYVSYLKANKTERRYIKQGSTWFNQQCWEDDYEVGGESNEKYSRPNGEDSGSKWGDVGITL